MTEQDASRFDPASFRDPNGRVVEFDGRILRSLSEAGVSQWQTFDASGLRDRLVSDGRLVPTTIPGDAEQLAGQLGVPGVLEHERLSFINYPYEWPFELLKQAALLHLDILMDGLDDGVTLQDATPFNVTWSNGRMVFMDTGSFVARKDGEAWAAMDQMYTTMIYPLLVWLHKGLPGRMVLRSTAPGIDYKTCLNLFSWTDMFRKGVLFHVLLKGSLQKNLDSRPDQGTQERAREASLPTSRLRNLLSEMSTLVASMDLSASSLWTGYESDRNYALEDVDLKRECVSRVAGKLKPGLVWDMGANQGEMSLLAARDAQQVVAFDSDDSVANLLAKRIQREKVTNVTPLVLDLSDPSPSLGWRNLERPAFSERSKPDLVLALALIHHLAISANIPLDDALSWLSRTTGQLVIEFVDRDDQMVKNMLFLKNHAYEDYNLANFERLLAKYFIIEETVDLTPSRRLFNARSKLR